MIKNILFAILSSLLWTNAFSQITLTQWDFEENPLLPTVNNPAPIIGSGNASIVGSMNNLSRATGSNTGCSQTSGTGSWAIGTAAPGTPESSGGEFLISTVGYSGIMFTYDHRMSNSAVRTERIQYTLDGIVWNNFDVDPTNSTIVCNGSYDDGRFDRGNNVGDNNGDSWSRKTIDFSSISGANNNPTFGVRIVAAYFSNTTEFRQSNNSTTIATGGTWRFDNVTFTAASPDVFIVSTSNFVVVEENAGTVNVPITIENANPAAIDLNFELSIYSNASETADFTWTPTLSIPANTNGVFNLPISIIDDLDAEKAERIIVKIASGTNATIDAEDHYQIIFIKDNDTAPMVPSNELNLNLLTNFSNGAVGSNSAEIVTFDPSFDRLYIANSVGSKLDIVDFANPSSPSIISSVDVSVYGNINSVTSHNGVVAIAIENSNAQLNGSVVFLDQNGVFISQVEVGAMPDMITFNKDYTKVLTANEGEPDASYTVDPEGSISIIDVTSGFASLTNSNVTTLGFTAYNGQEAALIAQGIRVFSTSASVAQDFEPEYIAVSDDNSTAFVTLQENNALVTIDLATNTITSVSALGYSSYAAGSGNALDASDQSGEILITGDLPIKGAYMPDAMTYATVAGQGYLFTANEGDSREFGSVVDANRISSSTFDNLDPIAFPDAHILRNKKFLGRLNALQYSGDTDNDGDFDELHVLGGRSFSIWDPNGSLVFDSKDLLEQITSNHPQFGAIFNASNSDSSPTQKNRSDDKGPEPEGITVNEINGSMYAFVSLERIGGVVVFNIDVPTAPVYVGYYNNRSTTGIGPDLGAEGIVFIPASISPNNKDLVILANEVSSTLSIYEINTCATVAGAIISSTAEEFCLGDSVALSIVGEANSTVQWLLDGQEIANETGNSIFATQQGDYTVAVNNSFFACQDTSNVKQITVNALPTVEAGTDTAICNNESLTLSATGATSYVWTNSVVNDQEFTPSQTEEYFVTGTDANGCSAMDSVTITVNDLPIVGAGIDSSICAETTITLIGSGATTYAWNNGVMDNVAFEPTSTDEYIVIGTDANGCVGTDTVVVTVNPLPIIDAGSNFEICDGQSATLNATGATTIVWDNGVQNNVAFIPTVTSIYTATGTDANGCVGTASVEITVSDCASILEQTISANIYPNPAQNNVNIELSNALDGTIELLDLTGKVLESQKVLGTSIDLDLSELSNGTYIIRITSPTFNYQSRIVKN